MNALAIGMMTLLLADPATQPAMSADELATRVFQASGGERWPDVARVRFTFVAQRGDRPMMRIHDWDLVNHTDTVNFGTTTVTANLNAPNESDDAKKAFGAWTNDSYWLMAPLKVLDAGVVRAIKPDETIDGRTYRVLHLSFENVGLTPSDQYNLYIDPQTYLVRWWDFIAAGGEPRRFSWEAYQDFNGIKLATKHAIDGRPVITFIDIDVTMK